MPRQLTGVRRISCTVHAPPASAATTNTDRQITVCVPASCAPKLIRPGTRNDWYTPADKRRSSGRDRHCGLPFTTFHHSPASAKHVTATTA
jgi:hypothetical protein